MAGKILFHEKCNLDLDTIAAKWGNRNSGGFHIWKGAMARAYEDIFEFRLQAGKALQVVDFFTIDEHHLNYTLRYLHLREHGVVIIYYINKEQNIIVLSIQETGLARKDRLKRLFDNLP